MFPTHGRFPRQMAIIGRLLIDYGEKDVEQVHLGWLNKKFLGSLHEQIRTCDPASRTQ